MHEGTINLTAKLDALDAKYVNATVGQIASILHAKPEYAKVANHILRAKALGIMAHPAVALSMLQGALQQPIFGTAAYAHATGLADTKTGNDHPSTTAPKANVTVETGPSDEAVAATDVIDADTGRINTDPHNCLGHACGAISVPAAKLQPRVQIYIHLNATGGTQGPATVEEVGTVAVKTLAELLDGKQVKITPVIDLNTIPAEHQYRPSHRLKEAVLLTFPKEAFPFSNRSSRGLDLDHTVAYEASNRDPQTRLGNFGPAGRRPHRAKTAGFWKCQQSVVGQLTWISPLGFHYTVDKDGTQRQE